jgi:hypothetical protein
LSDFSATAATFVEPASGRFHNDCCFDAALFGKLIFVKFLLTPNQRFEFHLD